ncbi:MAG: hypothetical protein FWH07_00685 [Oscillospiraceae bacterium]|nr:hypothetical protein [Oscillospiraceae bacterium]
MKGVIKQGGFISVTGVAPLPGGMQTPTRSIDNGEKPKPKNQVPTEQETIAAALSKAEIEAKRILDEQEAELEELRQQCKRECDELLRQAEENAEKLIDDTNSMIETLRENAENDCVQLRKKAEETGYSDGFAAGEKPGYDTGFQKGKDDCTETLKELGAILENALKEKEQIFKDYENQLFDLIFTISNKITAGSLNQKDKAVISKMLKEAAKNFRGSAFVKISLSKLDIEESVNVDLEDLTRVFGDNQHIEFEVLKDAPKGTLILDNGSEIADAGIQTQLKMIENLGKGKFRNKPDLSGE